MYSSTSSSSILDSIPNWVGFGLGILAGVVLLIAGIGEGVAGLISFGIWGVVACILAWRSGAKATPDINPFAKKFGATVKQVDQITWLIIAALFVVALVIALFV